MSLPEKTSLDNFNKDDIAVCPNCGVIFIKKINGQSFGLFSGRGYFCPNCDSFVTKK